jgi:hypothetical protein
VADPAVSGEAVWTQHTAGVSSAETARTFVSWYELIPALCSRGVCQAGAKRQEGAVGDPSLSVFNAAISPDSRGQNVMIHYNAGGSSSLVAVAAQGRTAVDPLGATFGPLTLATSQVSDTDFSCTPRFGGPPCRWGDYAGASPDPVATDTVWGSNMLAGSFQAVAAPTWTTRNFAIRPWESLGGQLAPNTGPDASSSGPARMDLFVQGQSGDLQHSSWNGTGWSGYASLGGVQKDAPGAASGTTNQVDAFVRGSDDALWHISTTDGGATWSSWQWLGGGLTAGPDAAAWAPNRLDVVVNGSDRQLWHRYSNDAGGTWSGWEPLGGVLTSAPGTAAWSQGRLDVFARGSDNALWHRAWDGAQWTPWQSLGGVLISAPDAASCGPGLLDVAVLGQDNAVWRQSWNGTAWSGWRPVGGKWTGDPSAVCVPGLGLNVFTQGSTDNAVWHTVAS